MFLAEGINFVGVSYIMVHIACFEEVYLHIRNHSGWFRERSFLKVGLKCIPDESRLLLRASITHTSECCVLYPSLKPESRLDRIGLKNPPIHPLSIVSRISSTCLYEW